MRRSRRQREMVPPVLPPDPEREQQDLLRREFLSLGFTEGEASQLAEAWANPQVVRWHLSRGCSYLQAVRIHT